MIANPPAISKKQFWLFASCLFVLTAIAFMNIFKAQFISWDDADLIMNNKDVQQFNVSAFFTEYYTGNYMPLTMLLHAINWLVFNSGAEAHHAVSFMLHGINGILVFQITLKLFRNLWGAALTALLFCLHPLQVESVAWIAETKTMLFSFFFLAGLNFYLKFLESGKKNTLYVNVLFFFILSLLSKSAAVSFPLCLIAIDLISGRKLTKQTVIEKFPFFILSIIIGLTAIYTQQQDRYINETHAFPFLERVGNAGYALAMYFAKFLLPFKLAVIYPYPQNKIVSIIMGYCVIAALATVVFLLFKKRNYFMIGSLLFILSHLILVLQLIPFGEVLTADRYMYLPLIGFSWMLTRMLEKFSKALKLLSLTVILLFGTATFIRTKVWLNSINLYSDILKNYPDSPMALNSLGAEFMLKNEDEKAYAYLNRAISLNGNHYKYYYNRGLLLAKNKKYEAAINDLSKSIQLTNYPKAYAARANVYYSIKDYSKAISDAEACLKIEPTNIRANYILANCYDDLNQLDKSMFYYNKTIELNSTEALFFMRRSIVFGKQKQFNDCLKDLETATGLDPSYAEAYYWKGVVKVNLEQSPCNDLQKAVKLGFQAAQGPLLKYCK